MVDCGSGDNIDAGDGGSGGGEAHGAGTAVGTSGQGNNGGSAPTNGEKTPLAAVVLERLEGTAQTVFSMLVTAALGQPTIIETVLLLITRAVAAAVAVTVAVTVPMAVEVVAVEVATVLTTTLDVQPQTPFLTQAVAVVVQALPNQVPTLTKRKWLAVMAVQASL